MYHYTPVYTRMMELLFDATHQGGRNPPDLDGFEREAGEWRLELGKYRQFIGDVTGVTVDTNISSREIKTIQSRLEGCISTYRRTGECVCDNLHDYEHIDSMETVEELARFFRVLVATRIEDSPAADSSSVSVQ